MTTLCLYPADPFYPKRKNQVDEQWKDEFEAVKRTGFEAYSINTDDLADNKLDHLEGHDILYRGWMLSPADYTDLYHTLKRVGANMRVTPDMYKKTHYLPEWYPQVEKYTAKTVVVSTPNEVQGVIDKLNWPNGYFLKDFVKSLKTGTGSSVKTSLDAAAVMAQMLHYRGQIEGGICIREHLNIVPDTEVRFFARNNVVYAPNATVTVPDFVYEVAKAYKDNFISIDVSKLVTGEFTLVELGNGQVSDYVGWDVDWFANMLSQAFVCAPAPDADMVSIDF